uniref:Uncharacterized protein n=1 Tax=Panagrolaimus sp. ES5 TaxID=591445 RepID=A0AC34FHK8_9BILA
MDFAWFSMCYHYMIIAWSRFAAIKFPNTFRIQSRKWSYSVCAGCYVVALIQVLLTHFQPWNKILHIFGVKRQSQTRYMVVPNGQTSCSPSPPLKGSERITNSRSIPNLAKVSLISYNKDPYSCAV